MRAFLVLLVATFAQACWHGAGRPDAQRESALSGLEDIPCAPTDPWTAHASGEALALDHLEHAWAAAEARLEGVFMDARPPLDADTASRARAALAATLYAEPPLIEVGVEAFYADRGLAETALSLAARDGDIDAAARWLARVDPYAPNACSDAWSEWMRDTR